MEILSKKMDETNKRREEKCDQCNKTCDASTLEIKRDIVERMEKNWITVRNRSRN